MEPVPNWNRLLGFGILKWPSLFMGVSESGNVDQQNRLFHFLKDQLLLFFFRAY